MCDEEYDGKEYSQQEEKKKSWYLHIRIDIVRKEASVSSNQNESPG